MRSRPTSVAEIRALAEAGVTAASAARQLGIKDSALRARARRHGISFLRYGRTWSKAEATEIRETLLATLERPKRVLKDFKMCPECVGRGAVSIGWRRSSQRSLHERTQCPVCKGQTVVPVWRDVP